VLMPKVATRGANRRGKSSDMQEREANNEAGEHSDTMSFQKTLQKKKKSPEQRPARRILRKKRWDLKIARPKGDCQAVLNH